MIEDGLHGTISEIKTQYITIPGTVVLSCKYGQYELLSSLRWRRIGSIISQGSTINPAVNGSERFRVINKLLDKQYVLQISKTTEEDLGLYVCEAQSQPNSIITETKFILKLAGKIM